MECIGSKLSFLAIILPYFVSLPQENHLCSSNDIRWYSTHLWDRCNSPVIHYTRSAYLHTSYINGRYSKIHYSNPYHSHGDFHHASYYPSGKNADTTHHCFSLYPISRWLKEVAQADICIQLIHLHNLKTVWAHFTAVEI